MNTPLDLNPFYFNRGQSATGVLLIHGWTGSPPEVRPMGEALAAQGYTVHGPLLPGHGTQPEALLRTTWQDWTAEVERALDGLRAECDTVFVGGLSMGGILTLYLGATQTRPLAGLICMSAPIFVYDWRRPFARWLYPVMPWSTKRPGYDLVDPEAYKRLADYRRFPTIAAVHLLRLMDHTVPQLGRIHTPILIMQGQRDKAVMPRSAQYIYDHVGSTDKALRWYAQSGHCITVDGERQAVWADAGAFMAAHAGVGG